MRKTRVRGIAALLGLAALAGAGSTAGVLDSGFGNGGIVLTETDHGELMGLAAQSDGSVIAVGHDPNSRWSVRRYDTDGTLDTAFEADANPSLEGMACDVAVDASDRVVVAGWVIIERTVAGHGKKTTTERVRMLGVLRLKADGSPDTDFGDGGLVLTEMSGFGTARAVAVQGDGRIVVAADTLVSSGGGGKGKNGGSTSSGAIALLRYTADGSLDSTFGSGGTAIDDVTSGNDLPAFGALVLQSDGSIVVGGAYLNGAQAMYLRRYDASGALDTSFGDGGIALSSGHVLCQSGLAVDGQDRLLAGGSNSGWSDGVLVRFLADGTIDTSFADGGVFTMGIGTRDQLGAAAVQTDGTIFVGGLIFAGSGYTDGVDTFVLRLDDDGALDSSFGGDGVSDLSTPGDLYTDNAPRDMVVVEGNPVIGGERFMANSGGPIDWILVRWCGN